MDQKEFYAADGKLIATITPIEPDILLLEGFGPADEHAASALSGYLNHLFEVGGVRGLIADGSRGFVPSREAIAVFAASARFPFIGRVGVFGVSDPGVKLAIEAIIKVSGRADTIKILPGREEAIAFVKNDRQAPSSSS